MQEKRKIQSSLNSNEKKQDSTTTLTRRKGTPAESPTPNQTATQPAPASKIGASEIMLSKDNARSHVGKPATPLTGSMTPYPNIDEVESHSTLSLDSARTHVLEQMNYVRSSKASQDNPLAALNAQANAAKAIAELVKAKVEIFKAYKS